MSLSWKVVVLGFEPNQWGPGVWDARDRSSPYPVHLSQPAFPTDRAETGEGLCADDLLKEMIPENRSEGQGSQEQEEIQ